MILFAGLGLIIVWDLLDYYFLIFLRLLNSSSFF